MTTFSIVICTQDRAQELQKTIQSLSRAMEQINGNVELLVVDNGAGSQDVSRTLPPSPDARAIHEPTPGLYAARNRGMNEASGTWLIYLDDDVDIGPGWLRGLTQAVAEQPAAVMIGGRVILSLPNRVPDWLGEPLLPALSCCDYPSDSLMREFDFPVEYPVGANFAVRRQTLLELGGFDWRLGRKGASLISAEETHLFFRLKAQDEPLWYCREAVVYHRINPARLEKGFFRRRFLAAGRSHAILRRLLKAEGIDAPDRTTYLRGLVGHLPAFIRGRVPAFSLELSLIELAGYLFESAVVPSQGSS